MSRRFLFVSIVVFIALLSLFIHSASAQELNGKLSSVVPFNNNTDDEEPEICRSPEYERKSKLTAFILSVIPTTGQLAVDRFYLGYVGIGILKLFVSLCTCGIGAIIWWIIDFVAILQDRLWDYNGCKLEPW